MIQSAEEDNAHDESSSIMNIAATDLTHVLEKVKKK
jgi:hypothetical protein